MDTFRVMPNHLHGILVIMGTGMDMVAMFGIGLDGLDIERADANEGIVPSRDGTMNGHIGPPLQPSLGEIIQWFKTMTTNEYIRRVGVGLATIQRKTLATRLLRPHSTKCRIA